MTPSLVSEMGSVASVACAHVDRHSGGEHLKVQSGATGAAAAGRETNRRYPYLLYATQTPPSLTHALGPTIGNTFNQ